MRPGHSAAKGSMMGRRKGPCQRKQPALLYLPQLLPTPIGTWQHQAGVGQAVAIQPVRDQPPPASLHSAHLQLFASHPAPILQLPTV
mmetsp:Transcript_19207/g.48872  ORF Transcript_19207/g.48872 Transcript_19207/m.48872 type:complete len:87 (-) Transcript_19207:2447-2707(-)